MECVGALDLGSSVTGIDPAVVERLGIASIGESPVLAAHGQRHVYPTYEVTMTFTADDGQRSWEIGVVASMISLAA